MTTSSPTTRRATGTGRSSWPRCSTSAPEASAMSARSFTASSAPRAAQTSARRSSAASSSRASSAGFSRSWTMSTPPASAASTNSTRSGRIGVHRYNRASARRVRI
ncbi:hypothetical protein BJF85_14010 [Saccharomonospora sp. CUA-673]|nr:hypothetical protein BJF85_14010 [Saccharomonospora sp. CUA-673]